MTKQDTKLTKWVLESCKGITRRLARDSSDLMVIVGKSKKLEIPDMKLIVPNGLVVYDVRIDYRSASQFFFVAKENDDFEPVYLSLVDKEGGSLNYMKNVGKLLDYPWFSKQDSAFIFDRLHKGLTNAPIYARKPIEVTPLTKHPFSRM